MRPAGATTRKMASELRRRDLMDAGERILVRKGIAATTVDDVTRAAGVAKGTFYLYFPSKEDLVAALRQRFTENCRRRIETLAARLPAADWAGRLDAWVEGGIRHYLDHMDLHDVVFHQGHAGEERHASMADSPLVSQLAELIRAGAAAGAWRVESPELVSLFLFYALHGIVDHVTSGSSERGRANHKALIRISQNIVRQTMGLSPVAADSGSLPGAKKKTPTQSSERVHRGRREDEETGT